MAGAALQRRRFHECDLLTTAGCIAKAGHHLVENEKRAILPRSVAPLKIAVLRRNTAHVGHNWFTDDGGKFASVLPHYTLQHWNIVPGRKHDIIKGRSLASPARRAWPFPFRSFRNGARPIGLLTVEAFPECVLVRPENVAG